MSGIEVGALVMGVGALVETIGGVKSNTDEAESERANSAFYLEQAQFAKDSATREEAIFTDQAERFKKNQAGLFARNGVSMTGSKIAMLADTDKRIRDEIEAIRREGEMNVKTATLRANASKRNADRLSDPWNNIMQSGGKLLSGGANILGRFA
jgi:coproporphyrinogen III oxidase-like Fe-S oxidoreductase